jgi:tyrosine-protein kinase Etk/Wzc
MTEPQSGNLWLYLELLAKRRAFILSFVFAVTVIAAIISFVLPKWYEANALLLPPKEASSTLDQLSKFSEVVSLTGGLNLPVMVTPSDVYARILRSHAVCDRIMTKFDLKTRYDASNQVETYDELMKHAKFRVTEEGLLNISVEDKDPQVAADMANAFVDEIGNVNQEIISSRTQQNRKFIEDRLSQVNSDLATSRKALEQFQETNKTVDFDEQTKLAIDQASALKVSLAQIDLELKMNEMTLGKDNPELIDLRRRRDIVNGQLAQLESGGKDSSFFSLPVSAIPGLKGQYELLYSRVRVNEQLYNMLLERFEQAKIQEKQDISVISVLDRAKVPELKSRPQRTIILAASFGLSLIVSILLAAFFEYLDRLASSRPEEYRRAAYVINTFFGWMPGVRRR